MQHINYRWKAKDYFENRLQNVWRKWAADSNLDLQNKSVWCSHGETIEHAFVKKHGRKLNVKINPEKESDKYALDLINTKHNLLADLKTQNTPFFRSKSLYDIDPQYAVTFNQKDALRYTEYLNNAGEIFIYFWVDWLAVRWELGNQRIEVSPMCGVWGIRFSNLRTILDGQNPH